MAPMYLMWGIWIENNGGALKIVRPVLELKLISSNIFMLEWQHKTVLFFFFLILPNFWISVLLLPNWEFLLHCILHLYLGCSKLHFLMKKKSSRLIKVTKSSTDISDNLLLVTKRLTRV